MRNGSLRNGRLITKLLVVGALLAGCSDDASQPDSGVDAAPDSAVDAAPGDSTGGGDGAATGSLSVKVLQLDGVYLIQGFEADTTTSKPASGATVAADLPGGERVEQTAGTDGKVEFRGVDWSKGTAAITAYLEGYRMASVVGIAGGDGEQTLTLVRGHKPATVKVTGTITNAPTFAYFGLGASIYSWMSEHGQSPTLPLTRTIWVEQGKPFTALLFALEKTSWTGEIDAGVVAFAQASHTGATEPVSLDLDLGNPMAVTTVKGTFTLPSTGRVATNSTPRGWIRQRGNSMVVGVCSKTTLKRAGVLDFEMRYVEPADTTGVYTTYYAGIGAAWHGSFVLAPGYPKDGDDVSTFLEVPEMVAPSGPAPMKLTDTIRWKASPDEQAIPLVVVTRPGITRASGETEPTLAEWSWIIRAKPGATELTLPALPTPAKADEVFGTARGETRVIFCADFDADNQRCGRHANGIPFAVDPS